MNHSDTQFIRALGIILILNSHLDIYYPIPYIGTGGAIGNSIFFSLSAFGIYLSQQSNGRPFKDWFARRISRIYPSLWIVLFFLVMPIMIRNGQLHGRNIFPFIGNFFNPPYWFLQLLLVYYLLSYHLLKNTKMWKKLALFLALSVMYILYYLTSLDLSKWSLEKLPLDLIHYFMIYLFGIFIASKNRDIVYSGYSDYLILIFFITLMYAHKFMMLKGLYPEFQIIQQVAIYPIIYYLLKISRSPLIMHRLMKSKITGPIMKFISNHTLEIYMIHQTISPPVRNLQLTFPYNVFILLMLTLSLSAIVKMLADRFRNAIA